ncbi:MAG: glutaredoxin domain-containing protein [Acidobacteriota bacterium]
MACERVKGFLSQAGVQVRLRDVDQDPAAYDELLARGWRSVPITLLGDAVVRGFDPVALQAAIDRMRASGSDA